MMKRARWRLKEVNMMMDIDQQKKDGGRLQYWLDSVEWVVKGCVLLWWEVGRK